jgi:hypothetical protein
MQLRFFADQCIPNSIAGALRDAGHEVLWLKEHIPIESPDPVVISKAQQLNCILFSLNGDFADIVNYPPANYQGVMAIQVRNHPETIQPLMRRLNDYLSSHPDMDHYKGKLFLVEVHRIRIRE